MANFIVLTGLRRATVYPLRDGMTLGRHSTADVRLPDYQVSGRHAEVARAAGGWRLRDLRSTNGTFRNGERVTEAPLTLGDIVRLGTSELLFTEQDGLDDEGPSQVREALVPRDRAEPGVALLLGREEVALDDPGGHVGAVHALERSLVEAGDLDALLRRAGERFARGVGARGVVISLEREGRLTPALHAAVQDGELLAGAPGFTAREELVERAIQSDGAVLVQLLPQGGPDDSNTKVWKMARFPWALCIALPRATGASGAIYLHDVRSDLTRADVELLLVMASQTGAHCRTHLLLRELRERNEALEAAHARLARWNDELRAAVEERTAELQRSERGYRRLFEESQDGLFTTDSGGRALAMNRHAAAIFGVAPGAAAGRPLLDLLGRPLLERLVGPPGEDPGAAVQAWLAARSAEVALEPVEGPLGERTIELLARPITHTGAGIEGLHVVVRDVTERAQAAERLRLLGRIVDNVQEAVVSLGLDGTVTSWNRGAEALYGHAAREVLGRLLPTVPDERGAELETTLAAVAAGRSLSMRTERVRADDERVPVHATFAPVLDARGEIVGMVELARDLREQLELEERMRWGERLASVGELAAGLAHELGNPLANLRSGVEFLLVRERSAAEARDVHLLLQNELERLQRLVKQVLDLARRTPPAAAPIDAEELADFVARAVALRAAERGVVVVRLASEGDERALGDPDQVKQALLNVADNALHAMQDGGRLELGTLDEPDARLRGWVVRDTGPGIDPDILPRVFEPFFSRRPGGSGIGLALVKRIVELHGGRVTLSSEPGQGTCVRILLPAAPRGEGA